MSDEKGKGFSSLDGLMSDDDLDSLLKDVPDQATLSQTDDVEEDTKSLEGGLENDKPGPKIYQQQGSFFTDKSKGYLRFGGVLVFLVFIGMYSVSDEKTATKSSQPSSYSSYSKSSKRGQSPSVLSGVYTESKPPVGRDLKFNGAQIRYCIAQNIRAETIEGYVDKYSAHEVQKFNELITDYNNRCGAYRYREGAQRTAQRQVDSNLPALKTEALAILKNWRGT